MTEASGSLASEPRQSQRRRQQDRGPEDEFEHDPEVGHHEPVHHRPSRAAWSISALMRARSSGVSLRSSSWSSMATAPSTEPPKNVLRTWFIAELRARRAETVGE